MIATVRTYRWWAAAGTASVLGLVALLVWWPSTPAAPAPRARSYSDRQACLLTPAAGLSAPAAAAAWAGLRDASARTSAQVRYLAVVGGDTPGNAGTFLASLASSGCGVVLAVGASQEAAAVQGAAEFPRTRFLVLKGKAGSAKVSTISYLTATQERSAVASAVVPLLHS